MMLVLTILAPVLGGIAALRAGRRAPAIGLIALGAAFVFLMDAWLRHTGTNGWAAEFDATWIAPLGVHFHLALDGLSFALALLTLFLGAAGLIITPVEIKERQGAFTALYLAALSGILGVFLAQDLFLFFVFYEIMLVPAYFLITQWGDDKQGSAATTFFIFTQTSGLVLLTCILVLALVHAGGGTPTFDARALIGTLDGTPAGAIVLVGLFLAFAVKLPVVPFHTWQAPTYAAAPAPVGILLAGLMSKAGAYGLLRFAIALLPQSAAAFAPTAMILGCVSLVYCGVVAYGQRDLKRLIAYSSAGHLAFVVLGAFALNDLGYAGAVATMLAHGLSVSGLFVVAGYLERNAGSRSLDALGGFFTRAPRTSGLAIVLVMATLGLPGLGNFVGEFLTLVGTFRVSPGAAMVGALGAVIGAIYALLILQRAFFGPVAERASHAEEAPRASLWVLAVLSVLLVWLGLCPQRALNVTRPAENPLLMHAPANTAPAGNVARVQEEVARERS